MKKNNQANFLFEAVSLKRLERTGWQILGGGNRESIAEHSFMVAVISYVLALGQKADTKKVLIMALFHDFSEGRTGDIYKLSDLYVKADITRATADSLSAFVGKRELISCAKEYENRKTLEAKIVHDADIIALCLELKQLVENGNLHAQEWLDANMGRLKLTESKKLLEEIKKTDSQDWWKKEREKLHKLMKNKRQ